MVTKTPIIEIDNFSLRIGSKRILDDVSLATEEGEYLTVIGPNGAGKTTLLRCLMRIMRGGDGTITVAGRALDDYSQRELAKLVGYVPQADGRALPFTVREFVMMGRYPHLSPFSLTTREDDEAVREAMELAGVLEFASRQIATLSGGERQSVFVTAALAQGAKILLLDEPATFLDPMHEARVHDLLRRVNRDRGVTVVAVTHDVNTAALQSDRVIALKEGRVIFGGSPGELMKNEVLERIYGKSFVMVEHPETGLPLVVPDGGRS